MLARKAELFLASVGSFFGNEQVMSGYTNLLLYELELRMKHLTDWCDNRTDLDPK
jgi:hypothetical protein